MAHIHESVQMDVANGASKKHRDLHRVSPQSILAPPHATSGLTISTSNPC